MKPNELMIGDLVYRIDFKIPVPSKIIGIEVINYDKMEYVVDVLNKNGYNVQLYLDEIEPIPLTPEILEKNGFMLQDNWLQDNWYCLVIGDDKIYVNLPEEGNIYQYTDIEYQKLVYNPEDVTEVEYSTSMTFKGTISVHQLQHAFKLCGIDKEIEL